MSKETGATLKEPPLAKSETKLGSGKQTNKQTNQQGQQLIIKHRKSKNLGIHIDNN